MREVELGRGKGTRVGPEAKTGSRREWGEGLGTAETTSSHRGRTESQGRFSVWVRPVLRRSLGRHREGPGLDGWFKVKPSRRWKKEEGEDWGREGTGAGHELVKFW